MVPPSQLSSEANAIVAAINGALAPRLDGLQGQVGMLAGSLKTDVVQLSAQVQQHDQRMSDFGRQLKDITAGRSCSSGAASSAASSDTHPACEGKRKNASSQKSRYSAGGGRFSLRHGRGRDVSQIERFLDVCSESRTAGLREKLDQWERSASTQMAKRGPSSENTRARSSVTGRSSCGTHRIVRKRKFCSPREYLSTGDQGPAHSGGGEGYLDQWCRDGHRWRLGERPGVVTTYRRANSSSSGLV